MRKATVHQRRNTSKKHLVHAALQVDAELSFADLAVRVQRVDQATAVRTQPHQPVEGHGLKNFRFMIS